ncbi:T9SS type A sorting domain-containing protein [Flavobacterium sp.]|uniref:T9SS type A sorting domain-containing protein n=1 Tax=Flavobacterium sp. TaxID=239 RepID=UPI0039E6B09C
MKKIAFLFSLLVFCNGFAQCWETIDASRDHSVGIKEDGTLWAWGRNNYGQLGDGTTADKSTPTQIGTDNHWISVKVGTGRTMALKSDGTIWGCGRNNFGQIGDGNFGVNLISTLMVQAGSDSDWTQLSVGTDYTFGIKSDGSLWGWGKGNNLGIDNDIEEYHVPARIGTANDWESVAAGDYGTLAIKTDHSLWAWGTENGGELGVNTNFHYFETPVQSGNNTYDWLKVSKGEISNSLMIKTDGSLWSMGNNVNGNVGNGGPPTEQVPAAIQIAPGPGWVEISSGSYHSAAIKSDGSMWTWGINSYGQIGDGTTTNRNIPTPVISSNSWGKVATGSGFTLGLPLQPTLHAWGWNGYGNLGNGTLDANALPLQVGNVCTLSVENFESDPVGRLYPNPVSGEAVFHYFTKESQTNTIQIFNALGQQLFKKDSQGLAGENREVIDFESYAPGVYFICLKSGQYHTTTKVTKH